jgi:bifunctional N-acetylglucosamine-1-phosphate-uridyltransferase/glucosamine-1-phosphate-acetyltransferase GlmU-like protein
MDKLSYEGVEGRLNWLISNGIVVHDRRQVFIGADVILENILPGTQLFPGTRVTGSNTVLGRNSIVGSEGPATLDNVVLDDGAEVASGFVTNSALLRGSRIGCNGHIRACTILEEEASTAHTVGLKQTILMS